MASSKQLAANRKNAKQSTGPKSAEGRARASRNAFRHGLSLAPRENPEALDRFLRLFAHGPAERHDWSVAALSDIADASRELKRVRQVRVEMLGRLEDLAEPDRKLDLVMRVVRLERYERRARHLWRSALRKSSPLD